MSWDEPVPAKHERAWKDWSQTLLKLKEISIPRWYFANAPQVKVTVETLYKLHAFSDGSMEAYGSAIYLRRIIDNHAHAAFVYEKSRVVLIHQQNWPIARKELIAVNSFCCSFCCFFLFLTPSLTTHKLFNILLFCSCGGAEIKEN